MDIWNYIKILSNKNQCWLFSKDNVEERLIALTKILENASPSTIHSLIPYLKDKNQEIQNATCNTIVGLLAKIKTKKGYYAVVTLARKRLKNWLFPITKKPFNLSSIV